jgi:glycosyltransferase involved in cell wall biosynthesis
MNRARVVFLAYYFPPLIGIASERAASLSRHLLNLGWEPTVITTRRGFYHRAAASGEFEFPVIRTPSLELSRLLRRAYVGARHDLRSVPTTTVRAVEAGRFGRVARRLVRDFAYVPDAQVGWIPFAAAAAARAVGGASPHGVLFSTSVPYSSHLAAMAASRRSGAGWVAEFRDPWSTSIPPARTVHPLRQRIDWSLEDRIVRNADHVIVTSEATRLQYLESHASLPPERISVVTNGFEPIPAGEPPASDEQMTILYAGTVATGEDLAPLLAVLDQVHARRPGCFRLRVLGPPEPWRPRADSTPERPWLKLDGIVTPESAREAMANSSALLLAQTSPAYRTVIPGKVFEYVGVRRPVISIAPPASEMSAIIRAHGDARWVSPDRLHTLGSTVEELADEHIAGTLQAPRVAETIVAPLRRVEQARKLAVIFGMVAR